MKQLGDITKINGAEIEPVHVITFGSPCQDLSVAGKRAGIGYECLECGHEWTYSETNRIEVLCPKCNSEEIASTRSGLFLEAIRIIREMREATKGEYPQFIVWENVPGAFSSNGGCDFKAVLSEISESEIPMPGSRGWATAGMVRGGATEIAWRVLDAQYWGVPQRRKRIFLVADFTGQRAAEVLFKPESMSGYIAESQGEREGTTGSVAGGVGEPGGCIAFAQNQRNEVRLNETDMVVAYAIRTAQTSSNGWGVTEEWHTLWI
jgi:DNA (cytosine-5)-methyltransferase 1